LTLILISVKIILMTKRLVLLSVALAPALLLPACAGATSQASPASEGKLPVMASFYPLHYLAERVGGEHVEISSLTPPGVEPHDLELSPAVVAELEQASAVVYLSGFQPAVDDAVAQVSPEHVVDVAHEAEASGDVHEHSGEHPDEHAEDPQHAEQDNAEQDHAGEDEHGDDHAGEDLHFWLDPERLAGAAHTVAHELGHADPENAATYVANADALAGELKALDQDFQAGLKDCETRTIVVSHEAYGFLAKKYRLEQVGISGLEPEAEPSPAHLAEIGQVVKNEDVRTIFSETLVNPKVAQTLATDLGVNTAVLDPLEGLAEGNTDYQQVMRTNLEALRDALRCQ
jgi:zinc transport system substrate-binding protein